MDDTLTADELRAITGKAQPKSPPAALPPRPAQSWDTTGHAPQGEGVIVPAYR